jgi:porin
MKTIFYTLAIGILLFSLPIWAQEGTSGLAVLSDSSRSGYTDESGFGGPKSIGAQLEVDNQKKESYFRIPVRVFKPWYETKRKINEKYGLQYNINYTAVFLQSSSTIKDAGSKSTSSGILDIQAGWNLVGRKSGKNAGTLFVKLNSRHVYGNKTPPMFHGLFESGYYGLPATGFRDYTLRFSELNWQQSLANKTVHFVIGKVDPTNYFNFHGLIVPWQHFLGYGSSVSGTVNWPDVGAGIIASYQLTPNLYLMGSLTDVRGDLFESGKWFAGGDQFFDGNFFKAVEVGYVPSFGERYFRKISVTYWTTDAYTSAGGDEISKGEGVAISGHWYFKDKYVPFARFAFSNGNGENAFYKKDIQIGHGLRFKSHDILGIGLSWAETNIPDAKKQMTAELFYRFNLTEHLEITPNFQYIINPTFNSDKSSLNYFGIRGRITL